MDVAARGACAASWNVVFFRRRVDPGLRRQNGRLWRSADEAFGVSPLSFEVTRLGDPHCSRAEIAGPLCTPLDALGRNVDLSRDVGVFQSGAYARTASPLGFLSHVTPAEVLVSGGRSRVIRRRGTYEDLMCDLE